MASKKSLAQRLFNVSRISLTNCRVSSPRVLARSRISQSASQKTLEHDPGDNGMFKRFFHRRAIFQNDMAPELHAVWVGDKLIDKLRDIDISKNRIRLDGLIPPPALSPEKTSPAFPGGLKAEDTKKLLRVAQLELVKMKLRETEKSWIPYLEFVRICADACPDLDQGNRIATTLDESGAVIVLGNAVLLRPEQVAKAIGGLIPSPIANTNDPRRKELEEMEKQKARIDKKAESLVRRELWCGLGYLVVQTAACMRLTFWELSWDVMEPICFCFTSMYFIGAYFFFLRTSKEPTFQSLYECRFSAKQKRLIKIHNFDIGRYNELRRACDPYSSLSSATDLADK
ncbi:calcium uniporter protein 2 mitochondrial-like [Tripterygium wilfordii]|uniref:Calcium uniporter protein 2 mitochondrial-like n=1 Tax=Tripterygium wilfordii TaxID=458696 RepID=A0A7J7CVZ1_TRIWF|nr:calcium uniporter protein 2, mitochondrial-like [Tripterygium wilfordii]KAF5738178.1 calcium uniporter protein 2 mitochondrial-like [Tripterygium wilfordii]